MIRRAAIFQIDQAMYQGSLAANFGPGKPGGPALANIWESLKPLLPKWDVVLAFTPIHADFGGVTIPLLDTVRGMGAKYCLDVFTSDNFTQPWHHPTRMPFLQPYAQSISFQRTAGLMQRHQWHFAGIRTHEFGFWYQHGIPEARAGRPSWLSQEILDRLPVEAEPLHRDMVEPFVRLCSQSVTGIPRFCMWCEPSVKPATAAMVRDFGAKYPWVVVPAFANNLGGPLGTYWPTEIQPCLAPTTLGWGLSVQSWRWSRDGYLSSYPPDYWQWVRSAKDALLVQFEPAWLHWNLPGYRNGNWEQWGPQHDGRPTPMLRNLIECLLSM